MGRVMHCIVGASRFQMAYALFRITLGVNMFFHGFMRIISDTGAWVDSQVALFTDIATPSFPVSYTHLTLPTTPYV